MDWTVGSVANLLYSSKHDAIQALLAFIDCYPLHTCIIQEAHAPFLKTDFLMDITPVYRIYCFAFWLNKTKKRYISNKSER